MDFDKIVARPVIQQQTFALGCVQPAVRRQLQAHAFHPVVVVLHVGRRGRIEAFRLDDARQHKIPEIAARLVVSANVPAQTGVDQTMGLQNPRRVGRIAVRQRAVGHTQFSFAMDGPGNLRQRLLAGQARGQRQGGRGQTINQLRAIRSTRHRQIGRDHRQHRRRTEVGEYRAKPRPRHKAEHAVVVDQIARRQIVIQLEILGRRRIGQAKRPRHIAARHHPGIPGHHLDIVQPLPCRPLHIQPHPLFRVHLPRPALFFSLEIIGGCRSNTNKYFVFNM